MKVIISTEARQSLAKSIRVLSRTCSKAYLRKIKLAVDAQVSWLKDHPEGGPYESQLEWRGQGHRRVLAGPFKIVYRISKGVILITDIFDARRDPKDMKG